MANQQKQAQQETAYMVYPCPPLHVSMTPFDNEEPGIHTTAPYRQFLVALVFADLPSLHPFIS